MVLALDKQWVWDSWYARDGETWHAFFLKADKSIGDPELRHFNVSQGHATSTDLVKWTYLGTSLTPSAGPAFDDLATWTGSVIKGPDGVWHLFYTGASKAERGLYQRIGHAVSNDLNSWTRVGKDGFCLDLVGPNAASYESEHVVGHWHDRAMRDPYVIADPEGDGYLMYFTARAPGIAEPNAGGAIGLATSPDLYSWTLEKPVFVGGFGQLEVPRSLSDRRALVLPVLHVRSALVRGLPALVPASAGHRQPLSCGRQSARTLADRAGWLFRRQLALPTLCGADAQDR